MSEIIISAKKVTKTYRLYAKPHYRFLDVLGLLRGSGKYSEHHALYGINLDVRRGEKVALIGRNGAGKSTLLKLITGVTQPSSGSLTVRSQASALLQIGTTFHPEFTGRENVLSYLAHLGIAGSEANEKLAEIIDFSELEEYIDQPVKTYSTGMGARLMFSASTIMAPDLLVIDEILSVGDAYFAHKSFERIKEMCASQHTTLLLVSHDIYSASKLCERMIWIERGGVIIDDQSSIVMKAYEDSIRVQEEARLLKKNNLRIDELARASANEIFLRVELRSKGNQPLRGPAFISELALNVLSETYRVPLESVSETMGKVAGVTIANGCWGEVVARDGRLCRQFMDHGSPFRCASAVLAIPAALIIEQLSDANLSVEYISDDANELEIILHSADNTRNLGLLPQSNGRWIRHFASLESPAVSTAPITTINTDGVHGTGNILVTAIRVLDENNIETMRLRHGVPMSIEIDYEIRKADLHENADLLIGFHRDGVIDVCRFFTQEIEFDESTNRYGTIIMQVQRLTLANGSYTISLTLARNGYYASNPTVFYSINQDVHTCLSRYMEVVVYGGDLIASGSGVVETATWFDVGRRSRTNLDN